jgi:Holliday junction resolvasome RuvABC endonuclease subunit
MKIVGIDASTNKTGIAVFAEGKYIVHTLIDCHKITDSDIRIPKMMHDIGVFLDKHDIDKIIMEKSIFKNNIDTVQKLSNIAGAVMFYATDRDIEFEFSLPSQWRSRVGLQQGKTKRGDLKAEAILAVEQEYGLKVSDDEAEAILLARSGFKLPKLNITVEDTWGE